MKKKVLIISLLIIVVVMIIGAVTKPDDKKIKIETVDAVWGNLVPDKNTDSRYYEQFMNVITPDIIIDDWIFLKRIRYIVRDSIITVGYAAFGKVIFK